MKPLRVLQIVGSLGVGGAETWLMELLRIWKSSGVIECEIVVTSGKIGVFDGEAGELGACLHYLEFGKTEVLKFARGIRKIIRQGRFDVIHSHAGYAAGWHFLMGLGLLPPTRVVHIHNPWNVYQAHYTASARRHLVSVAGKRLVTSLATHVCGTSSEVLCDYGFRRRGFGNPDIQTLHCGFNIEKFNAPREVDRAQVLGEFNWPLDSKIVLYVGRFDKYLEYRHPQNQKNTWLAFNILREAVLRDQRFRVIVAGDGPSRGALTEAISEWGLSEKFRLLGIRDDIPRLMRASDALLFPSTKEGLGMVAVEAQAASLPVLASDAVPQEAIVIPKIYRALPVGARIECWVDQLFSMVDRPRLHPMVCRRAFENSDFSIKNSSRKLEAVYRSAT